MVVKIQVDQQFESGNNNHVHQAQSILFLPNFEGHCELLQVVLNHVSTDVFTGKLKILTNKVASMYILYFRLYLYLARRCS